jgi:uncharacterized protein YjdB
MLEAILPANATDQTVTWSVANGTGSATISAGGLLSAVANGTVTARATANDGSGIIGDLVVTISNQNPTVLVTSITVTGQGGATTITTQGGTLQMLEAILPANATNQTVTWSVANGTGSATISAAGLLTATGNGTVTVTATAADGSGITGTKVITISNQSTATVLITSITVDGQGGASTITTQSGTLQMIEAVLPVNATNSNVTWSVANGTGSANIGSSGALTATGNGTVTVTATAADGSGITGTKVITISNQTTPIILVATILVQGQGGISTITTPSGTLQMVETVLPSNATDKNVTWTVTNGTGSATINPSGLLTATTNGTVTVTATANDGSTIIGTKEITISNQNVGIKEVNTNEITIFPNPATNYINVTTNNKIESLTIYSFNGQVVVHSNMENQYEKINVSNLSNGSYIIVLTLSDGVVTTKKWMKK